VRYRTGNAEHRTPGMPGGLTMLLWVTGLSLLGVSSPKLTKGFTMSDRFDAENCHQNQTHHQTQCSRSEAA
jgi:hypothetical protein